jgi:hypothetical protein
MMEDEWVAKASKKDVNRGSRPWVPNLCAYDWAGASSMLISIGRPWGSNGKGNSYRSGLGSDHQ